MLALNITCRGDFIVVGDALMSLNVFRYNAVDSRLEDVASDQSDNHVVAVELLDDTCAIAAEDRYNLFVAQRHSDATSDEVRSRVCVRWGASVKPRGSHLVCVCVLWVAVITGAWPSRHCV